MDQRILTQTARVISMILTRISNWAIKSAKRSFFKLSYQQMVWRHKLLQKKEDDTAITVIADENVIKRPSSKGLNFNFGFWLFKHPVYPYEFQNGGYRHIENFIARHTLNSSKQVLCVAEIPQHLTSFQNFF